jgi:hypothetical protein
VGTTSGLKVWLLQGLMLQLDYIFRNFLHVFDTCFIPSMRTLVQSKYAMIFILKLIPAIIAGSMLQ